MSQVSYEQLYEEIRNIVERAALDADASMTLKNFRHLSHDATFEIQNVIAKAIRSQPSVDLASVLFVLGERP